MTFWLAGAAWYSLFYYDYYMYTLDKDFLRERALPFMEQAALFYEDFLKEGNDGSIFLTLHILQRIIRLIVQVRHVSMLLWM